MGALFSSLPPSINHTTGEVPRLCLWVAPQGPPCTGSPTPTATVSSSHPSSCLKTICSLGLSPTLSCLIYLNSQPERWVVVSPEH